MHSFIMFQFMLTIHELSFSQDSDDSIYSNGRLFVLTVLLKTFGDSLLHSRCSYTLKKLS